jgi:hypothetical protein
MSPQEKLEKGLMEGFVLVIKRAGRKNKLLAFARNKKTEEEVKLKIPRDTLTTVREMRRLMHKQGHAMLCNPRTGEYYVPPFTQSLQFSKTPGSCS